MNYKNGFTLVELLAVVVILSLLIGIAVPGTLTISNKLKTNMYCKKIESIEIAAKVYGEDRRGSFTETFMLPGGETTSSKTIRVSDLITSGDLKKDNTTSPYIVDPRNNEEMDNLELTLYLNYNRVYVSFDENVSTTCDK